jgi:hypothetical protein
MCADPPTPEPCHVVQIPERAYFLQTDSKTWRNYKPSSSFLQSGCSQPTADAESGLRHLCLNFREVLSPLYEPEIKWNASEPPDRTCRGWVVVCGWPPKSSNRKTLQSGALKQNNTIIWCIEAPLSGRSSKSRHFPCLDNLHCYQHESSLEKRHCMKLVATKCRQQQKRLRSIRNVICDSHHSSKRCSHIKNT